jgi:hypothetical protein
MNELLVGRSGLLGGFLFRKEARYRGAAHRAFAFGNWTAGSSLFDCSPFDWAFRAAFYAITFEVHITPLSLHKRAALFSKRTGAYYR